MNAQGSVEWLAERAGCVTASRASDVLAKIKTGEAALRRKYRIQLTTERLTGIPVQGYVNAAMQWGTDTEPMARMAYEAARSVLVEETGFCKHPTIPYCGASPDGLLGDDGLVEIKCAESTTHVDWMTQGRVPPEHIPQMQFQLWVTGRKWCEFVSFDPRMPANLQLFVRRVERDEPYIKSLATEVISFLDDVEATIKQLERK